jgi:hypothetical protein
MHVGCSGAVDVLSDGSSAAKLEIREFQVSTPCDWYKETRLTNTWVQRDQAPRGKYEKAYEEAARRGNIDNSVELKAAWAEIVETDLGLRAELDDFVSRCGWPSKTAFGIRAVEAAYIIVLHAPLQFKQKYLPVMTQAKMAGELEASNFAYITDKILVAQNRPQRYGTQVHALGSSGNIVPFPIEDESKVDELRAAAGIIPASLCAYLSMMDAKLERCDKQR